MTYSLRQNRLTLALLVVAVLIVAFWTVPWRGSARRSIRRIAQTRGPKIAASADEHND
jgi:hypothetical protein